MVKFKRVSKKDLKRLNDIINSGEVSQYLVLQLPVLMKETREVFERWKRDNALWYCIIVEGAIAGSVLLEPRRKNSKQAHVAVFGISIAPEFWGKGIGDAAINFIIAKARKMGLKRIELSVVEANTRARRLYERHGFKKEGVKRKAIRIGRIYHNDMIMARWLK